MMRYKGYIGRVEYDDEAKVFHGEVIGLKDVITFQGTTVRELDKAFKDSIDDYFSWCKERGEKPERSYSGVFNVRTTPDIHANLVVEATKRKISLNELINEKLSK
jgi:predicted HicB family RNase H-like nuclease